MTGDPAERSSTVRLIDVLGAPSDEQLRKIVAILRLTEPRARIPRTQGRKTA